MHTVPEVSHYLEPKSSRFLKECLSLASLSFALSLSFSCLFLSTSLPRPPPLAGAAGVARGKTKTCIIATVSPNSANIEETLGTLDYACRAKNIKNTPEINQVQTKKTMMRDMSKYIADLQNQLKAQRDGPAP